MAATGHQGPVFVIIRFPVSRVLSCKNSLMKTLSVHRNYSGDVSGISSKLYVLEGNFPPSKGVAILSFQSIREADLWKDSVPEIRQHDWLDGVDMIIVPVCKMPPADKRFVQMMDLRFRNVDQHLSEYSNDVDKELQQAGACGGVVSTCADRIQRVKGLWDPAYLVMNFWPSQHAFEASYNSEKNKRLKEQRCDFADTVSCVFQLDPLKDTRGCE